MEKQPVQDPPQWVHLWWQHSLLTLTVASWEQSTGCHMLLVEKQGICSSKRTNPQPMPDRECQAGLCQDWCQRYLSKMPLKTTRKLSQPLQYLHLFPNGMSYKCHNSSFSSAVPKAKLSQCQLDRCPGERGRHSFTDLKQQGGGPGSFNSTFG